jgi:trehalose 6-phosphate synthase
MTDIVVVSNRGPLSFRLEAGRPVSSTGGGGLAATLRPLLAGSGATWIASILGEADRLAAADGLFQADGLTLVPVQNDPDVYSMAYDVISNGTLWFVHHHLFDLPRRPRFDWHWHEAWAGYRSYNRQFANAVGEVAPNGAVVLVQDYHFSLVGSMLAQERPDLVTVHFHHTPFTEPETLAVLPHAARTELLSGLAGFSACGFHTARWESAFQRCYTEAGSNPGVDAPRTFVSPLGPSVHDLEALARGQRVDRAMDDLAEQIGDRKLIVRVDRMEMSKNLLRGFWAYEELLETRPRWRGEVVFAAFCYPSRETLADYLGYRSEVDHTVARINDRFGSDQWTPILYDPVDDLPRSMAALRRYDVLLVNPIRDGLNMVAKEGPWLNQRDGVLVLSREAGAWAELADAALGVNPYDVSGTAAELEAALSMELQERARRASALKSEIGRRSAADWLEDQLAAAQSSSV